MDRFGDLTFWLRVDQTSDFDLRVCHNGKYKNRRKLILFSSSGEILPYTSAFFSVGEWLESLHYIYCIY